MQDMPESKPANNLTFIAFDFGLRRLGVAVGQSLTQTAQPLATLSCKNGEPNWNDIQDIQNTWRANAFVIGLPIHKDGTDSPVSSAARIFAQKIKKQFHLPVHLFDERYSSITAEEFIKTQRKGGNRKHRAKKEEIDRLAAAVILQNWFLENLEK